MLDVSHVRKDFGAVCAVRDVTFSIETGTTFGLLGPNGAGKTTTMRMLLGIYAPDAGEVRWNGARVTESTRRRTFGYLPEERGLYGKMKVREQIEYFARLHGLNDAKARAGSDLWIERLGLSDYAMRPCAELSKGNQQKVQVACAAVHRPQLLILDEPFSGLDPVNAGILLDMLASLKQSGTTLVLSSHQMWQLEELCDAFCIITNGENRASGTLAQLRAAWPTRLVEVEPPTEAARAILQQIGGASAVQTDRETLRCDVPAATDFSSVVRSLVAAADVTRFEAIEPSLQDIYLHTIASGASS